MATGIDGYEILDFEVDGHKIQVTQLHSGAAYAVPDLFAGWRYAGSVQHGVERATLDIQDADYHAWNAQLHATNNPLRPGSGEHLFAVRQLEDRLKKAEEALAALK